MGCGHGKGHAHLVAHYKCKIRKLKDRFFIEEKGYFIV